MKVLYFIASHVNPEQVVRLVRTIKTGSPSCAVLIHHDYSKSCLPRDKLVALPDVFLMDNYVRGEWGDFSLTSATLRAINWSLENVKFDWFVFLSGQDYPLKPLSVIERFLNQCGYDALLRGFLVSRPNPWSKGEGVNRYFLRYYKLPTFKYYYRFPTALRNLLGWSKQTFNTSQPLIQIRTSPRGLPARVGFRSYQTPFDQQLQCYGGPTWFDASSSCLVYIRDFIHANPSYVAWYKRTFLPDESFFATILLNQAKFNILLDNKRYVHWNPKDPLAASPQAIQRLNIDEILNSGAHFARKFDSTVDSSVLDFIDQRITESPKSQMSSVVP